MDTNVAQNNCGMCGRVCPAGQACAGGVCAAGAAPANDTCVMATPIPLVAGTATVRGSTILATNGLPSCLPGHDVYYSITLATREIVYLDTYGSSYDTVVGFVMNCAAGPSACNDDSCGTLSSQLTAVLDPGTYIIVVDGFAAATNGGYVLNIEHAPVNGASSGNLAAGVQAVAGTTVGAANSAGSCGAGLDRWYSWTTCPSGPGGTFTATTCGPGGMAAYDSVLQERNGTGVGGGCNDDSCGLQSNLSAMVPPRAGLHVMYVDGIAAASGAFRVVVSRP